MQAKYLSCVLATGAVALMLLAVGCSHTVEADERQAAADPPSTNDSREIPPMEFDHIGLVTTEKKSGELYIEATKVWVTNFQDHPFHIEWLRYEPDSPVTGPVREMAHVAYRVASIAEASQGMKVLIEPFEVPMGRVGFYQTDDGAVVEFMEYKKEGYQWEKSEK